MTILPAYWFTSAIWEPPKPRFTTESGFMSSASVYHRLMVELPVKTILPSSGGWTRSAFSNSRIEDSQDSALLIDQTPYPTMPQPNSKKTRKPKRVFLTLILSSPPIGTECHWTPNHLRREPRRWEN